MAVVEEKGLRGGRVLWEKELLGRKTCRVGWVWWHCAFPNAVGGLVLGLGFMHLFRNFMKVVMEIPLEMKCFMSDLLRVLLHSHRQ